MLRYSEFITKNFLTQVYLPRLEEAYRMRSILIQLWSFIRLLFVFFTYFSYLYFDQSSLWPSYNPLYYVHSILKSTFFLFFILCLFHILWNLTFLGPKIVSRNPPRSQWLFQKKKGNEITLFEKIRRKKRCVVWGRQVESDKIFF